MQSPYLKNKEKPPSMSELAGGNFNQYLEDQKPLEAYPQYENCFVSNARKEMERLDRLRNEGKTEQPIAEMTVLERLERLERKVFPAMFW